MKLYNKTKCPTEFLEPLLVAAGRAVGAKTTNTVVKVTSGRTGRVKGEAINWNTVSKWHLVKGWTWAHHSKNNSISCDGYFSIVLPMALHPCYDPVKVAESFFKVAMHEWAHIKDYQSGGRWSLPWSRAGAGGRRPRHDSRPEELRAINAVDDAVDGGAVTRHQGKILLLAFCIGRH